MNRRAASIAFSFALLTACASQPPPRPALTASTSSAAPAAAAQGTPSERNRSSTGHDPVVELHNYALSKGYKSVSRNGKQVWCRQEPTLGSHFETMSCMTDAVLADLKRKAEENEEEMIHEYRPNCVGPTCTT